MTVPYLALELRSLLIGKRVLTETKQTQWLYVGYKWKGLLLKFGK
jgi:hypothetical protein